jgi:hypothetical protein
MERADFERLRWRVSVELSGARYHADALSRQRFRTFVPEQQQAFVELADMEDHELWYWVGGKAESMIPVLLPSWLRFVRVE